MVRTFIRLSALLVFIGIASSALAADVMLMSTDQLKSNMSNSNIAILDARGSWDWDKTDDKITGATRVDPGSVSVWSKNYDKEKTIVLYCA